MIDKNLPEQTKLHINDLAGMYYYYIHRTQHPENYRFDKASIEPEKLCWELACISYFYWDQDKNPVRTRIILREKN